MNLQMLSFPATALLLASACLQELYYFANHSIRIFEHTPHEYVNGNVSVMNFPVVKRDATLSVVQLS